MKSKKKDLFFAGIVYSAGYLAEYCGNPGLAEELLRESGITWNELIRSGADIDLKLLKANGVLKKLKVNP